MKIQFILPKWSMTMPWVDGLRKTFSDSKISFSNAPQPEPYPDLLVFLWCDEETVSAVNRLPDDIKKVVFLRRYELFSGWWTRLDWKKVDHLVCVNSFILNVVKESAKPKSSSLLYNIFDPEKWSFGEHGTGYNLAMVGNINARKNVPLALQILAKLPKEYKLHLLGASQDPEVMEYTVNFAKEMERLVYVHEEFPPEKVGKWLENKDFVLSCAVSEGNPNSIIQAMAKGIKVLVHNWPGAKGQFPPELIFNTVDEAVRKITVDPYESKKYRDWADKHFSLQNLVEFKKICEELVCQKV